MKPDPPVLPSGKCAVCGKPRLAWRSKRYGRAQAEADPFCSTTCARSWHGCELEVKPNKNQPRVWRHGTMNGYRHYGCRCAECKRAAMVDRRRYKRAA